MYGKSRYLSHFKELYYTFIVSECQMNMKIRQGEKFPDQSFLQKNILFGAVFFKTTRNIIFFKARILDMEHFSVCTFYFLEVFKGFFFDVCIN